MRKFIVITLSLLIVVFSFVACFADSGGEPVIIPQGGLNDYTVGHIFTYSNGIKRIYRAEMSPMYMVPYSLDGGNTINLLTFSEIPNNHFYFNNVSYENSNSRSLSNQYNGYYYLTIDSQIDPSTPYMLFDDPNITSVTDVIDYIDNSVFSTTFDLTYLVNGSVSWLSTFAQAVKNNALLLFFVVFIFVGIGIGLLNRFRRG